MENVSFSSGGPDWLKKFSNRTFLYACFINLSLYIFILLSLFPQVLYLLNDSLLYLWPFISSPIIFLIFHTASLVSLSHTSLSTSTSCLSCHAAKTQSAFESKTPGKNAVLYIFNAITRRRWSPRICWMPLDTVTSDMLLSPVVCLLEHVLMLVVH